MPNNINTIGYVIKEPESRTEGKSTVVTVRINVTSNSTFVDVKFYGKHGELAAQHAKKGSVVIANGSLETNLWETIVIVSLGKENLDVIEFAENPNFLLK